MERYEDFSVVTDHALRQSLNELGIAATGAQIEKLTNSYLTPTVFPDARRALDELRHLPLGILSNGSPAMLAAAVRAGALESRLAHVISVDTVRTYKPSPRVYALGPATLNLAAAEILFVSSNLWDAEGAKSFGYPVCWCNRASSLQPGGPFAPDLTVTSLDKLAALLT
jgi:2-haloacid dehalogenase